MNLEKQWYQNNNYLAGAVVFVYTKLKINNKLLYLQRKGEETYFAVMLTNYM